jgi:RNA polymerase sigma factor (sigma-70 family)
MDESKLISNPSVSQWIEGAKQGGGEDAERRLFERYWPQVLSVARRTLEGNRIRHLDEEDVAIVALRRVFERIEAGKCDQMLDRRDWWNYVKRATKNIALDAIKGHQAAKHGGGEVRGESALDAPVNQSGQGGLANEPKSPHMPTEIAEDMIQMLLESSTELGEAARLILIRRLEGYKDKEIAEALDVTTRTIERKKKVIERALDKLLDRE